MPDNGAAKRGTAAGGAARRWLAERRKALGLTQEALADLMGVERSTVVRWERGETAPLPFIRPKLARALRVSADRLGELLVAGAPPGPDPSGPESGSRPRQLPPTVAGFTGRAAELAALTKILDGASAPETVVISAIGGTAGVGKTALAVQWAHQVAGRFPDGQLYVNLHGYDPDRPMPAADALAGFLRGLGVPGQDIPPGEDERAARYRSLLAGRKLLVVLDNAGSVEQVRPLLPGSPSCAVLVTSRDSLAGLVARHGATRLEVDLLPPADAASLLRALIGQRAKDDPGAAGTLAAQCCRLPLALRVAAELAIARPGVPLADLAAELADQQRRLDLLDAGGDSRTAVRAVFSWSYRHLEDDSARAFRLAGLHPGPDFDPYAVAALTGTKLEQARTALDALARAHLIHPAGRGRHGMHDLLRAYARELADATDGEEEQNAALTRLFDYYLHTADTTVPSPARMWNYWVGGKDHFAADREAADKIMAAMPSLPAIARSVRRFLIDIVRTLTVDYGIRQFLDVGTGLPTADNTHDVAQRAAPESRIVYADYDLVVLAHARALLTSSPEGETDYIQADLRETDKILTAAAKTLDFGKPVAILLLAVLHFIPDEDDPYGIVRKLMDAVPSGSFLVIVHAPSDLHPEEMAEQARRYNESGAELMRPRSREEILRFFTGLELLEPGLALLSAWLPPGQAGPGAGEAVAGVARKP
jgi:transcriptional regulator with XRE-family HTH domain